MREFQVMKQELQEMVHQRLDMSTELSDEAIGDVIDEVIMEKSRNMYMSSVTKLTLRQELFNAIRRLDLLQELIDDKSVSEIMVNGADSIFYERNGKIYTWDRHFESREKLEDVIQQIVSRSNRQVNESVPIVDARLSDGSRVNVVLDPVALNGPILTIRKFPEEAITMEKLIEWESLSQEAADYLKILVQAGYNIFISGATSTGKTTFLNVLADYIPKTERVITIEDSAELQLHDIANLVRMEVRQADAEGVHIKAMNTGHDGSLSTGHANSPEDMLSRIETMILMGSDMPLPAIRKQIASSIDIIIQLGRLRDRSRRVTEITEVLSCDQNGYVLNKLFQFNERDDLLRETSVYGNAPEKVRGGLDRTGYRLMNRRKLRAAALESPEI